MKTLSTSMLSAVPNQHYSHVNQGHLLGEGDVITAKHAGYIGIFTSGNCFTCWLLVRNSSSMERCWPCGACHWAPLLVFYCSIGGLILKCAIINQKQDKSLEKICFVLTFSNMQYGFFFSIRFK